MYFMMYFASMYSYLFFGLMVSCFFLIIECLKNFRTNSVLKFHFIGVLILQFFANYISYLNQIGIEYFQFFTINKIVVSVLIVNILILIIQSTINKYIFILELVFVLFYLLLVINGFHFTEIKIGQSFPLEEMQYQALLSFAQAGIFIVVLCYFFFRIINKTNGNNLYFKKIRKWTILILFFLFISVVSFIYALYNFYNHDIHKINQIDSRTVLLISRAILLLFILLRPKFINDAGLSFTPASFFTKFPNSISKDNFDFLFFKNHYYLNPEANLEDFSIKLNLSKSLVSDYLNNIYRSSFNELLNQNRIKYFTELLRSNKQDSFTIEALSEMSGFKSRKTMYNTFNKYHNMTPSEFINNL
jgi:AraC-like DNA-binding protein